MKRNSIVRTRKGFGVITDTDGQGLVRVARNDRPDTPGTWMRAKDVLDVVAP